MSRRAAGMSAGTQLPRLTQLNRALERQTGTTSGDGALAAITRAGLFQIQSAQHASITVFGQAGPQTLLVTSEVASGAQTLHHQLGQGPDLEPVLAGNVYLSRDLASEKQWPLFAAQIREQLGLNCLITHRVTLPQDPDTIIGLTLYSSHSDAFDGPDVWASSVLAGHCALAIATQIYRSKLASIEHSPVHNGSIGAAIEVLAARHDVTSSRALELLHRLSRDRHQTLSEVAAEVISAGTPATGDLPEAGPENTATPATH